MNLGIIGYVPPPQFGNGVGKVFLDNLRRNKPSARVVLYSDHRYPAEDWFKLYSLKASPEVFKAVQNQAGQVNKWGINNAIWVTGMNFARMENLSHIIYLESDCRFGEPGWDLPIWEESFGSGKPLVAAGSLVVWNPALAGMEGLKRWEKLIVDNANAFPQPDSVVNGKVKKENFPIPCYGMGQRPSGDETPAVFPNGALGFYDMAWIQHLFDVTDTKGATRMKAWDFALGERLWKVFGIQTYDVTQHLQCIFSSYGDAITTEPWRLDLLKQRRVTCVHQVKSPVGI